MIKLAENRSWLLANKSMDVEEGMKNQMGFYRSSLSALVRCQLRHTVHTVFTRTSAPSNKRRIRDKKVNKRNGLDAALIRGITYNLKTTIKEV